jgi:hypothetical protein
LYRILKQAPWQWYEKFKNFLVHSINFVWSDEDHCLYGKHTQKGSPIFLILYMDNMLLFSQHIGELDELYYWNSWWRILVQRTTLLGWGSRKIVFCNSCIYLNLTTFDGFWSDSICIRPDLLWHRYLSTFDYHKWIAWHLFQRGIIWSSYYTHRLLAHWCMLWSRLGQT